VDKLVNKFLVFHWQLGTSLFDWLTGWVAIPLMRLGKSLTTMDKLQLTGQTLAEFSTL
jgi:hypothetical protein